jgi:hypothetical protein
MTQKRFQNAAELCGKPSNPHREEGAIPSLLHGARLLVQLLRSHWKSRLQHCAPAKTWRWVGAEWDLLNRTLLLRLVHCSLSTACGPA